MCAPKRKYVNGDATGNRHYCPLDLVEIFLRRFVIYPSEHALVAHVLWIGHTHFMEVWDTSPRLAFMSAEKESGKTRALEITKLFVPEPELFVQPSAAVVVRLVNHGHEEGNTRLKFKRRRHIQEAEPIKNDLVDWAIEVGPRQFGSPGSPGSGYRGNGMGKG